MKGNKGSWFAAEDAAMDELSSSRHPQANHSFTRRRSWLQDALLAWLSGLETTTL